MVAKKTILIKSSHYAHMTRLPKEIDTLARAGYRVSFLGWNRDRGAATSRWQRAEKLDEEIRLDFRAPYGAKVLLFLPIWWLYVFFQLMTRDWDIADAINLDSAIPAVVAGRLRRKPVVYEMMDVYADQILLPGILRAICITVDKVCARLARCVIVTDESQIDEMGGIPNPKVLTIYESPFDIWHKLEKTALKMDGFTLFTAGELSAVRRLHLDAVFAAVSELEGVKLVIAGEGDLVGEIKEYARQVPDKVQYLGWLSRYEEVITRMRNSDLVFSLRDPVILTNRHNCGAKVFEAMMCGKPLLVSKGTSMAARVTQEDCGLAVEASNVDEIKKAIVRLRDDRDLCQKLGANARRAFEQKYSWNIMERHLIAVYEELVPGTGDAR